MASATLASSPPFALVGLAYPLVDIVVSNIPHRVLEEYGLKADDAVLANAKTRELLSRCSAGEWGQPLEAAGGASLNTVRLVSWLLSHVHPQLHPLHRHHDIHVHLEWQAAFIGRVGGDAYGALLAARCEAEGVAPCFQVEDTAEQAAAAAASAAAAAAPGGGTQETQQTGTGVCAVLVCADGARTLVTYMGSSRALHPTHITQPSVWSRCIATATATATASGPLVPVAMPHVLYTCGFMVQTESNWASLCAACRGSVAAGRAVAVNLSACYICTTPAFHDRMRTILCGYTSIIVGNAAEACAYAATAGWPADISDIETVAARLAALSCSSDDEAAAKGEVEVAEVKVEVEGGEGGRGCPPPQLRLVAITCGADATVVALGGPHITPVVHRVPVPALPPASVIDTTGAGDAFAAGLLAGLFLTAARHSASSASSASGGCWVPLLHALTGAISTAADTAAAAVALSGWMEEVTAAAGVGHWAAAHVIQRRGVDFDRAAACPLLQELAARGT